MFAPRDAVSTPRLVEWKRSNVSGNILENRQCEILAHLCAALFATLLCPLCEFPFTNNSESVFFVLFSFLASTAFHRVLSPDFSGLFLERSPLDFYVDLAAASSRYRTFSNELWTIFLLQVSCSAPQAESSSHPFFGFVRLI